MPLPIALSLDSSEMRQKPGPDLMLEIVQRVLRETCLKSCLKNTKVLSACPSDE